MYYYLIDSMFVSNQSLEFVRGRCEHFFFSVSQVNKYRYLIHNAIKLLCFRSDSCCGVCMRSIVVHFVYICFGKSIDELNSADTINVCRCMSVSVNLFRHNSVVNFGCSAIILIGLVEVPVVFPTSI